MFPNEILSLIFGHLHQPYHYHHYSNALQGITAPAPPGLTPWNPVGLQLVCRRWRALAQKPFYSQVALPVRDANSMELLVEMVMDSAHSKQPHPYLRLTKSIVVNGDPFDEEDKEWVSQYIDSLSRATSWGYLDFDSDDSDFEGERVPRQAMHTVLSTVSEAPGMIIPYAARSVTYIVSASWNPGVHLLDAIGEAWEVENVRLKRSQPPPPVKWPKAIDGNTTTTIRVECDHRKTLRLVHSMAAHMDRIRYVPRLHIDLVKPYPAQALDRLFPHITTMLRHSSHLEGCDIVRKSIGTDKTIAFGVQSKEVAADLRARIDALGTLAVLVEVSVLDVHP